MVEPDHAAGAVKHLLIVGGNEASDARGVKGAQGIEHLVGAHGE